MNTALQKNDTDLENGTPAGSERCSSSVIKRVVLGVLAFLHLTGLFGVQDDGSSRLKVRSLRDRHTGYPRLATFLDSDENFMVYRRFGFVQARLLLDKQNELQYLERQLDKEDKRTPDCDLQNAELGFVNPSPRKEMLRKLETKYLEYAQLLKAAREMVAMRRPTETEYQSVSNFCYNDPCPLSKLDMQWVDCKEDLVTLRPGREHAWLDDAIERGLRTLNYTLVRNIFCSKEDQRKSDDPTEAEFESVDSTKTQKKPYANTVVYFTRSRIEGLAACIITAMVLVLLVVPTYILYHLTNDTAQGSRTTALCIGVLLVFTLAFSAILALFTRAKRHEILAAAAAYCAVLVVFFGNVPQRSS